MKITNKDLVSILNFPDIILKNTYNWRPHSDASIRRYVENKILNDMFDALKNVIGDGHVIERKDNTIYIDGVKIFSYNESSRNVYKAQNLTYVKTLIDEKKIEKMKMLKLMEDKK